MSIWAQGHGQTGTKAHKHKGTRSEKLGSAYEAAWAGGSHRIVLLPAAVCWAMIRRRGSRALGEPQCTLPACYWGSPAQTGLCVHQCCLGAATNSLSTYLGLPLHLPSTCGVQVTDFAPPVFCTNATRHLRGS